MRLEQRHLFVEGSLDLGEFDLSLRLDLEMDGGVLRLLLIKLGLAERGGLVELRPRLYGQQFRVGCRLRGIIASSWRWASSPLARG